MKRTPEETLQLIKEAMKNCKEGAITIYATLTALSVLVNDSDLSQEAIAWGKKIFEGVK